MHIFIDESGTFTGQDTNTSNPSVVGALVIPEYKMASLASAFARMRLHLPQEG